MSTLDITGFGGGSGGGSALLESNYFEYVGEAALEGNATSPDTTYTLVFSQDFLWNDERRLFVSQDFIWNDGSLPLRWFRVVGCCRYPTTNGSGTLDANGNPTQPGGCSVIPFQTYDAACVGQSGKVNFIQNILARNLTEVCEYLRQSNWVWPICSISVYSRLAENRLAGSETCNTLTELDFSEVSACLEFTLKTKAEVNMAMTTSVIRIFQFEGYASAEFNGDGGETAIVAGTGTTGPAHQYYGYAALEANATAPTQVIQDLGHTADMGITVGIEDLTVSFSTVDNNPNSLVVDSNIISTDCGCDLPLVLAMSHNLNKASVLMEFCTRNGIVLPTQLPLHYSRRLESWQSQLHYTGFANDNSSANESWRILFDWACVDSMGGQDLGGFVWKYGLSVVRKNNVTNEDFDTRFLLAIPRTLCESDTFDFTISFNTQTGVVSMTQGIFVDMILLYDNIGLFKSSYWVKNPIFKVRIARAIVGTGFTTQDISPIFPVPPVFQG